MAKRAKIFLARAKHGELDLLNRSNKKPLEIKYQQELEEFTDEDRQKPKKSKN